jgi:hypothetical protein
LLISFMNPRWSAPVPLGELLAGALRDWHRDTLYAKADGWVFPSWKLKGKTPLSASIMAADKIRSIDAAKLEAQEDIALAITSTAAAD